MKIALFVHCFFPTHFYGTETYTLELATNLRALGHDAVVVSAIFPGESATEQTVSRYEYAGVPVYSVDKNRFPDTRIKDTYYQPALRDTLRQLLSELQPDIVHVTHLINHTAVLLEVIAELGIPVVGSFTDFFGFCYNNKLEAANGELCVGPNSRRTNCLACFYKAQGAQPDRPLRERLFGKFPFSRIVAEIKWGISHLPGGGCGQHSTYFSDIYERPALLARAYSHYRTGIAASKFLHDAYIANSLPVPMQLIRFGTDIERKEKPVRPATMPLRLGFVGQIAPHKGTDILLEAFCRLPKGVAELRIYGPEDQDRAYMARLKSMAAGHAVSFLGTFPKEKLTEVFAELDFLVIPSTWYENSPLVLLNALASHTPAIVSDVAGMTEFVEDGKNGFIFKMGSVADLERVLQKIVSDPEQARAMTATTEYLRTTKTMTEEVVAVYDSVAGTVKKTGSFKGIL